MHNVVVVMFEPSTDWVCWLLRCKVAWMTLDHSVGSMQSCLEAAAAAAVVVVVAVVVELVVVVVAVVVVVVELVAGGKKGVVLRNRVPVGSHGETAAAAIVVVVVVVLVRLRLHERGGRLMLQGGRPIRLPSKVT